LKRRESQHFVSRDISMRIDIEPTHENGLRAASQVMVDWPQTVRLSDMGQAIGRLDMATMRTITRQMAVVLGIGSGTDRPRQTRIASAIEPSGTT
jgi:mRNA-degrading endonuclease toxin of MazEF toxin-antitoxin module